MTRATAYDPFARGPLPVGVRTLELVDASRQRPLPTEVWYPTTDAFAGLDREDRRADRYVLLPGLVPAVQRAVRDAPPRDGSYPLVVFSHGYGAHRRQSTFFCTHLASHGYVVAAPDHTGNTTAELISHAMHGFAGTPRPATPIATLLLDRPPDVSFVIDEITTRLASADRERVGVTGHSFGGWTTLAVTARDDRVRAAVPLAPAGGSSAMDDSHILMAGLRFDWRRAVPTLFIVAERDSLLPLAGMRALYDPITSPKQLVVLRGADHLHFCDDIERIHELFRILPPAPGIPRGELPPFAELCPAAHGYDTVSGLGLAHLDAHLRERADAREFLAAHWRASLVARGVHVDAW